MTNEDYCIEFHVITYLLQSFKCFAEWPFYNPNFANLSKRVSIVKCVLSNSLQFNKTFIFFMESYSLAIEHI